MADHFSDRYWSTGYWSVRYFQGGEADPNALSAVLSGASTTVGTVSAAGHMSASLSGTASVAGGLAAVATIAGRSKLSNPDYEGLYHEQLKQREMALAQAIRVEDEEIMRVIQEFLKVAA
jgi:hypothetical protein